MGILSETVVQSSKSVLGFQGNAPVDFQKILNRYLKGDINSEKRVESKVNVMIHLIEKMKLEKLPVIPVRNQCKSCEGRGFNLEFFEVEEIKCPDCIDGWKFCDCKTCSGTGRIGEIPCHTCKDTGVYVYRRVINHKKEVIHQGKKCIKCSGKQKIKKLVQRDSHIKLVHNCDRCKGTGISTTLGTSVLSLEHYEKIKEKFATSE